MICIYLFWYLNGCIKFFKNIYKFLKEWFFYNIIFVGIGYIVCLIIKNIIMLFIYFMYFGILLLIVLGYMINIERRIILGFDIY